MIQPLKPGIERTKVIHGAKKVVGAELHLFSEAKTRIDICMDSTQPPLEISIEPTRRSLVEVKRKGLQLRYLTEITNFINRSYSSVLVS